MEEIHRTIFNRLLTAWIAISLATGAAVFYIGIEKIDDQLVDLAVAESGKLSSESLPLLNRPEADRGALQTLASDFVRRHFIVVELYDKERRKVSEAINPRHAAVEEKLKAHAHPFPRDDQRHYEKFVLGEDTVLRVLVPLKDANGSRAGYFEGVFLIDPETLDRLRREMAMTLVVVLCAVLLTTVVLYPVILALNRDVIRYSRDLLKGNVELMEVLGSAIAKRDSDTNLHNYRVAIYAVKLAEAAGVARAAIRDLIAGAFLHDVGKIGISDNILLKPGRLDEQEFAVMRTHVSLGVDILEKSAWLQRARDVVEFHHERYDGSGYLRGLKGEEIPVTARVFAVVDIFDALTSKRPYKDPIPFAEALDILRGYAGNHLDARLVEIFAGMIEPLFREICASPDKEVEQMLKALINRYIVDAAKA
ncbi:MAG: HD domain-containing protein [Sterolibacteriaceae bacterium MAG5]|nr:HD domain-containing protein [Candidatus Nitricoxidireducens bremensis]